MPSEMDKIIAQELLHRYVQQPTVVSDEDILRAVQEKCGPTEQKIFESRLLALSDLFRKVYDDLMKYRWEVNLPSGCLREEEGYQSYEALLAKEFPSVERSALDHLLRMLYHYVVER